MNPASGSAIVMDFTLIYIEEPKWLRSTIRRQEKGMHAYLDIEDAPQNPLDLDVLNWIILSRKADA